MSMLAATGAEITRVVVKDLVTDSSGNGSIFHGSVFLQIGEREVEIDSRASDAIALAVRCDARILVSELVVDRSSIAGSGEEAETGELGVFRQFIESLPDEPPPGPGGSRCSSRAAWLDRPPGPACRNRGRAASQPPRPRR